MGIEPTRDRSRSPSLVLKTRAGTSRAHTPVCCGDFLARDSSNDISSRTPPNTAMRLFREAFGPGGGGPAQLHRPTHRVPSISRIGGPNRDCTVPPRSMPNTWSNSPRGLTPPSSLLSEPDVMRPGDVRLLLAVRPADDQGGR